jgi:hypothetical protein
MATQQSAERNKPSRGRILRVLRDWDIGNRHLQ